MDERFEAKIMKSNFQELINLTKKGLGNNTNIYPSDISQLPIPDLDNKLKTLPTL